MNKFEKLGLSPEVVSVLSKINITEPTEIQEKTIPLALAGHDIIGGSATGSGKTLAFSSSLIEKLKPGNHVQALILTPTRELADQVSISIKKFAKNKSLNTFAVYGGVDIEKQIRIIRNTDILVGTPGRIIDHLNRRTLRLDKVKFLVLDEVDRMFDMGFQKDVESIIRECPENRQTMFFSATISTNIDYLTKKHTKNAKTIAVKSNIESHQLKQIYYEIDSKRKFSLLFHFLKKEESKLAIVFCSTRNNADFVADNLSKLGLSAKAIHGGLVQNKRNRIIKELKEDKIKILVGTDVAARGLDISGITHVYNYDLPKDSKDYVHRIGRTARAGKEGTAINILASRDYDNFNNILENENVEIKRLDLPEFEQVRFYVNPSGRNFRSSGNSRRGNDRRPSSGSSFRGKSSSPRNFGSNNSRGRDSGRSDSRGNSRGNSNRNDSRRNPNRSNSRKSFGSNRNSNPRSSFRGNRSSSPRRSSSRNDSGSRRSFNGRR